MPNKVLITGGSGFVGRALSASLLKAGHEVWSPDFDLTLPSAICEISELGSWDVVVHLAGISDTATCAADPAKAKLVNVDVTGELVKALSKQKKMPHFIFASSAMVYQPKDGPLKEDGVIEPQNAYASTKYAAELVLRDMHGKYEMPITILRLFNHTHFSQDPRFFLPYIYQCLLKIKKSGEPSIAVGNISVKRDLGTIQDLLAMFTKLIVAAPSGLDVMNVCSGQARFLKSLAVELARKLDVSCDFIIDPSKLRADHNLIVGSSVKIEQRLDWCPEQLSDANFIERFLQPF